MRGYWVDVTVSETGSVSAHFMHHTRVIGAYHFMDWSHFLGHCGVMIGPWHVLVATGDYWTRVYCEDMHRGH